ncbi:aldehyde dehydrogenase [Aulographum hederae CBS 113979]|uniref:aldehyde dehydrogenase (NAD(+)) n=1 Tax=Aulographum hederae CBS 113979 TaxID=1176131 RepID=A0A6G1H6M2_9PEZI|nr:aldehyde dehydrogenase [Aulographum hederae CBS 113979]
MSPSKVSQIDFKTFYNVVDGKQRGSKNFHQGINPATAEKLWDVPIATQQDVDDAVDAAQKAFKTWGKTPIEKRKELMKQFGELFAAHTDEFLELSCKETGKPKQFAVQEVGGVKAYLDWHRTLDMPEETWEGEDRTTVTRYVPLGVVGAICPWNFPLILSIGKIAPALLTGCCIIVKPSPFTPYTALKMIELAQEVFPPGVIQVLGGDDRLGPMFTAHPGISKISFTGSIATGKRVMEAASKTLKRVTLELGGNDAAIVLPDVDIAKTAPQVAMGAFQNSGQVCVATKRIYIHESIYTEFVKAMTDFAKGIKVGPSMEEGVMMGPIQNEMQYEKVKTFFKDSKDKGYKFAAGSHEVKSGKGYFIQPTIIDNPPNDSKIITEEPFGPIVPCQPYSSEEEVIARANNVSTGLGATVWSKDIKHAQEIGWQLEAGNVFINSFTMPIPQVFFSGHKESGIGGEWGKTGLLSYCNALAMHTMK